MTEEELINKGVEEWKNNKGIGTFIIYKPMNPLLVLSSSFPRLFNRSPTMFIVIVVNNFEDRNNIIDYLTKSENEIYNNSYKSLLSKGNIKIWTKEYIEDKINRIYPHLVVYYNPNRFDDIDESLCIKSRFKLIILNKILDKDSMNTIHGVSPVIPIFKQKELDELRVNRPVEEYRIGLTIIDDKTNKLLKYYNEEINRSICIFGSLDNINIARIGDKNTNMSAIGYCNTIAEFNGWRYDLDMTSEFNRQLDEIYNPNSLKERADNVYDIIRKRGVLIANNEIKLQSILDIVKANNDKRILIISKYPDFATTITEYLNSNSDTTICMNYHNKLESIPACDIDGDPIYIKSGINKGERKMMGVIGQKKLAQQMFNLNKIHVLSANNLPDDSLDIYVDIVILTSSFCEDIQTYFYRMTHIEFANKVKLYTLFCKNSIEERAFENKKLNRNHIIVNSSEIEVIDDKNSDIILVD